MERNTVKKKSIEKLMKSKKGSIIHKKKIHLCLQQLDDVVWGWKEETERYKVKNNKINISANKLKVYLTTRVNNLNLESQSNDEQDFEMES